MFLGFGPGKSLPTGEGVENHRNLTEMLKFVVSLCSTCQTLGHSILCVWKPLTENWSYSFPRSFLFQPACDIWRFSKADLVRTFSAGYIGGAGNYLGANLGPGGYGAGNVGQQPFVADGDVDIYLHYLW